MVIKRRSDGAIFRVDHNFLMNSEFEVLDNSDEIEDIKIEDIKIDDIKTVSRPASISVKSK